LKPCRAPGLPIQRIGWIVSGRDSRTQVEIYLTYSYPQVILLVIDNGVGFQRNTNSAASRFSITGIGLLSMRERVASLGGTIEISSTPGRGTRIRVVLPGGKNF
jgi:signal transduction histidine kinase